MAIRRAVIDGGVSYHQALMQAGEPFAGFERLDVRDLASARLEAFSLLVVPRSTDGELLFARRYQIARFLECGGVLVTFGEQPISWFPGSCWEAECPEDVGEPVVPASHPLLEGLDGGRLEWHPRQHSWCCHGHFRAPAGAEVLVANRRGDAWLYVDRVTTNGVIVAASNLDPDTHAYYGNTVARDFLERLLEWAGAEAEQAPERGSRSHGRIAGLYSGVHFQRAFFEDEEFSRDFCIVPAAELPALPLNLYAALWIPRESNQNVLWEQRERLAAYVRDGGTIVAFDEIVRPWLPLARWAGHRFNLDTLTLGAHPIIQGLTADDVRWHSHGTLLPYAGAEVLIGNDDGEAALYVDERSLRGRILAGTLDPDTHAGFGSQRTRPLLRRIIAWARSGVPSLTREEQAAAGSRT